VSQWEDDGEEPRELSGADLELLKSAIRRGLHRRMDSWAVASWVDHHDIDISEAEALCDMLRALQHFEFMRQRYQVAKRLADQPEPDDDLDEHLSAQEYDEDAEPDPRSEMDVYLAAIDNAVAQDEEAFREAVSEADAWAERLWGHTTEAQRDEIKAALKAAEAFHRQGPPIGQNRSHEQDTPDTKQDPDSAQDSWPIAGPDPDDEWSAL